MKILLAMAVVGLIVPSLSAAPKRSTISDFGGNYSGTVDFATFPGTVTGSFKTSSAREKGTLTLISTINSGGATFLTLNHILTFRGRKLVYLISSRFLTAPGTGTVKVRKKVIKYVGTANYGGTAANFTGTIRPTRNGLLIVETTVLGTQSQVISYTLKSKHRK